MPQTFSRLPPLGAIFLTAPPPLTWNPGSAPVMISVLTSSVVDYQFNPRSGQTYTLYLLYLRYNHASLMSKNKEWLCSRPTFGKLDRLLLIGLHALGASCWSYLLSAVQVQPTTHCMFYREQHWALHLLRLVLVRLAQNHDNVPDWSDM
jgi:hypothetical protein